MIAAGEGGEGRLTGRMREASLMHPHLPAPSLLRWWLFRDMQFKDKSRTGTGYETAKSSESSKCYAELAKTGFDNPHYFQKKGINPKDLASR